MKKSSIDTCCLTLPLKLEKWQEDRLAKRFEIARQLYNTLVHAELKRLVQIKRAAEYLENEQKIRALDRNNPADRAKLQELYKEQRKSLKTAGFTDYSFTTDMGKYYKHFRDNIGSSVAVHGIAPQVWAAFDKVLFKKGGKKVHYKKPGEVNSVQGYSRTGKSGGTEIMFRGPYIEWKGDVYKRQVQHVGQLHDLLVADALPLQFCGQIGDAVAPVVFLGQPVNHLLHGKSGADDLRLDLISDAHKILPNSCDENSEVGLRFRKPASLFGVIFCFSKIRWKRGG